MYLEEHIGKEIVITLKRDWRKSSGNLARWGLDFGGAIVARETLVGVDGLGVWIERENDEHIMGTFLDPSGQPTLKNEMKLHILVPWDGIAHIGVIVEEGGDARGKRGLVLNLVREEPETEEDDEI